MSGYIGAVEMMMRWHLFFSLSIVGIIGGMLEAAVVSFIILFALGAVYNRMV
jgi:hypothetical protein